ncbi:MAG: AAA family ATPase [Candidatus Thorarchaeota archaeon]|nr:AAA family ATPase [Candidatus Thorarchaeota archaeon]
MVLKRIQVTNFRSLKYVEIDFKKFNVFIGANASGKSNFVQIFQFLKDIISSGLENAISLQGGIEYLCNMSIGSSEEFSLKIVADEQDRFGHFMKKPEDAKIEIRTIEVSYEFALKFNENNRGYQIVRDILTLECRFIRVRRENKKLKEENIGRGTIVFSRVKGKVEIEVISPKGLEITKEEFFPPIYRSDTLISEKELLLHLPLLFIRPLRKNLEVITRYNFDPELSKRAVPITGKANLEEDGSNLPIIITKIIADKDQRRKLLDLVKDILPFINRLDIEKSSGKTLIKVKETYLEKQYLPSFLISDGTIKITALTVALYFEERPLIIIEKPERNIHPHLMSKIVDMMRNASEQKQIIVITDHPEIVKHVDLDNIFLITRDKKGVSTIT